MLPRGSMGIIRGAAKTAAAAGSPASPVNRAASALPAASKAKPYVALVTQSRPQTTAARDDGGANAAGGEGGEHHLSGTAGSYLEEMYESWSRDPSSVHASWNAYFSGSTYTPPPTVGNTKPNEVPLAAFGDVFSGARVEGAAPSSKVIDAHLAVQATIRSYQVRGHLAAQIDPLDLNNMNKEEAKKLIIRSVQVQEGDMDTVYQLPATTWIGGKVRSEEKTIIE